MRMSSGAAGFTAGDLRAIALQFQRAAPRAALAQIGTTLVPLVAMMAAMHAGLAHGWWWLVPALALPAAA
ncbi:MAG: hypothetical protein ICV73_10730, partial [Acetobacteraceae bacterium]|nr:hypothetical protein [Acetobacteraceae bacterium]